MPIKHIQGDLFAADVAVIAHGINMTNVEWGGVAGILGTKYPKVRDAVKSLISLDALYPGCCAIMPTGNVASKADHVANLVSQVKPGADARLGLIMSSLIGLESQCRTSDRMTVAIPRIGCGIGGLTWEQVEPIMQAVFEDSQVELQVYYL